MEAAVEKHNPRETAVQRLARQSGEFATSFMRMVMLAAMLTPILLLAIITVDIPFHGFDWLAGEAIASRPANWLTYGGFFMNFGALLAMLFARKYGGDEASRAITASWGLAAVAVFAELSYLAPRLDDGDLPGVRFTVLFTASAMAGQYIAANFYDVARGAERWWRAPLYGALAGYLVSVLIYFPGVYWGTGAPWLNWMIGDFAIKAFVAICFLPFYGMLRGALRPRGGYGGR
ncbi:MAG: VUT family protein [Parvularculaceae bacterium]